MREVIRGMSLDSGLFSFSLQVAYLGYLENRHLPTQLQASNALAITLPQFSLEHSNFKGAKYAGIYTQGPESFLSMVL